jgi:uncharacterized protein YkwD
LKRAARALGGLIFVVCLAAQAGAFVAPAPAAAAAYDRFYANFQGEELMRAMNADRTALGLGRLAPDPVLERIARDRALVCPSDSSLTIRGRARDMADRGYLSHTIPGCKDGSGAAFDGFDLLAAFGYSYAAAGENIADNTYPSSAVAYATGCSLSGGSCSGSINVPSSVAFTERFFMGSSAHRAAILSTSYDHFGCAAWNAANGTHYYDCYFIRGGSAGTDAAGPAITNETGAGASYVLGATPTFGATAADGQSLLSDGYAAIDGTHIRDWADDHTGSSAALSAKAPPLTAGTHTFTWWVRDASSQTSVASFQFTVTGQPAPTPTASPRPTASPSSRPSASPKSSAGPGTPPTAAPATTSAPASPTSGASQTTAAARDTPPPTRAAGEPSVAPSSLDSSAELPAQAGPVASTSLAAGGVRAAAATGSGGPPADNGVGLIITVVGGALAGILLAVRRSRADGVRRVSRHWIR